MENEELKKLKICRLGIPEEKIKEYLKEDYKNFEKWIAGQTGGICNGEIYNHEKGSYENCGPHGFVIYSYDFERYLRTKDNKKNAKI